MALLNCLNVKHSYFWSYRNRYINHCGFINISKLIRENVKLLTMTSIMSKPTLYNERDVEVKGCKLACMSSNLNASQCD